MGDERRVVDFPVLTGVASSGEPQRGLCDRQPGELAARRAGGRAVAVPGALSVWMPSVTSVATL